MCVHPFFDPVLEPSWKAIKRKTGQIRRACKFHFYILLLSRNCILLTFESALGTKLSFFCSDDLNSFSFSPNSLTVQSFRLSL